MAYEMDMKPTVIMYWTISAIKYVFSVDCPSREFKG